MCEEKVKTNIFRIDKDDIIDDNNDDIIILVGFDKRTNQYINILNELHQLQIKCFGKDMSWSIQVFSENLRLPNHYIVLAVTKVTNKIIGFCCYNYIYQEQNEESQMEKKKQNLFDPVDNHGMILCLCVDDSYRCKGIGKLLLQRVINTCNLNPNPNLIDNGINIIQSKSVFRSNYFDIPPSSKLKYIYLQVRVDNVGAIKLYKKVGFKINKTLENYYGISNHGYLMRLKLN